MFDLLILFIALYAVDTPKASSIIEMMNKSILNIKNMEYDFSSTERWHSKVNYSESHFKVRFNPIGVYLKFYKSVSPAKEILYNPELYGSKAQISIGKFFPTIGLNILNAKMRKEQHHTLLDVGFGKINSILYRAYKADIAEFDKLTTVEDNVEFGGRKCWKLVMFSNHFAYVHYIVKQGESLNKIATNNGISGYLIFEKNNLKNFDDITVGQDLLIPNAYSKRFVCLIDKETHLPIYQEVYDDKALFEKYIYTKIRMNYPIPELEFSKDNKDYGI